MCLWRGHRLWSEDWAAAVKGVEGEAEGREKSFLLDMQMQATLGLDLDRRLLCEKDPRGWDLCPRWASYATLDFMMSPFASRCGSVGLNDCLYLSCSLPYRFVTFEYQSCQKARLCAMMNR